MIPLAKNITHAPYLKESQYMTEVPGRYAGMPCIYQQEGKRDK